MALIAAAMVDGSLVSSYGRYSKCSDEIRLLKERDTGEGGGGEEL